ncbi:hypothetical protein [Rhizobium alvei]|uniref:Uncharacterized protein n=1 Tax=Rhizobium alvei TaxID=1132659 RepID=A0ABT8YFG1_9HYPH|nr:hypothetical protein [Rhizobium alvei]MDO6962449.1 hypothetical protein [Rhizobium alvei]
MGFEFTSETGKIPKGYGFILKPTMVRDALVAAGVEIDCHLIRSHGSLLFDAYFWPPNQNVPHERLYLRAGTVSVEALPRWRHQAEIEAIPRLVRWISAILAQDPKSPVRREEKSIQLLPLR